MTAPTTGSRTLRMPAGWRWAFTAVTAFFAAGFAWNLLAWARGELEWTTQNLVLMPVLGLLVLGLLVGLVVMWTERIWVDHERNELHWSTALGAKALPLDPPTTVRIGYRSPTPGTRVIGSWRLRVTPPDGVPLTLSTPSLPSLADTLEILRPAYARNPGLAEDDATRRLLEADGQVNSA